MENMEKYTVPERLYPYFPNGFASQRFGNGTRVSTLTGCDLYMYKQDLEVRAAILCGVLFPGDCQDMRRGINIVRAAERVVTAAKEAGESIGAITVETLLERAWSDGGKAFMQLYEHVGRPTAVREYQGIVTGDNPSDVSAAFIIEQGTRSLDNFVEKYIQILVRATKLSTDCTYDMPTYNYRLEGEKIIGEIQKETGVNMPKGKFQKELKELTGYNEQLHIAGLSQVSDFDTVSKELATASLDKRQVS